MAVQLRSRVLVVGLDGATLDIIDPLLSQGKLPNLAKLVSTGVHGTLRSTILPLSPTAWTSFATGKNAGKHGIYDFAKRIENSYDYTPTTSMDQKSTCMWDTVGSFGGKSIIVNVPLTYPPKPLNGFMISGFPTPTEREDYTYPSYLLSDLKRKFGKVKIHKPTVMYRKGREEEITRETIEITRQQTAITRYLMESIDWRITVSVYDATDTIGHCFWAYLDKNHPKYDPKLAEPVRRMVEEIHVELDRAVGELVEAAGSDCLHLVISDHGFGPVYYGVYLNTWLLEQKYMYFKKRLPVRARYWAYRRGLHTYNLLQLAKKLRLVKSVESAYSTRSFLLKVLKMTSLSLDDVDWQRTRVYSFGNFGQLYLNLRGREPKGIVPPEEANELVKELVAKLGQLEDPVTHRRMFDHIYTRGDVFSGDAMSNAPDIVFFDEEMMYAAHRMFELGSNKLVTLHPVYSGHHKMDGVIFMAGKGVKFMSGTPNLEPRLVDIAPTILHYLGSPLPDDMDGRIFEEFFETSSEFAERQTEYTIENGEARKIQVSVQKLRSSRPL